MKFTVDRSLFADAVAWVARSASSKSTYPIMSGVLMDVDADLSMVTLSAFDYEKSGQVQVPAEVADPGDCLLSAELLKKIMDAADGDAVVEVVTDDSTAQITCGRDKWDLTLMPAYDYPTLPAAGVVVGEVDAEALAAAFKQVVGAVAKPGKALVAHTAIHVSVCDGMLGLAATDRPRLAVAEVPFTAIDDQPEWSALVPPRSLKDFLDTKHGTVQISLVTDDQGTPTLIGLSGNGRRTIARLLDGEFPAWRSYMAQIKGAYDALVEVGETTTVQVAAADLVSALTKAGAVLQQQPESWVVWLHLNESGIGITGGSDDTFATKVDAEVAGAARTLKMNLGFLSGAVGGAGTDEVLLQIYGATKPVLMTPVGGDSTHQYMIMPLRA